MFLVMIRYSEILQKVEYPIQETSMENSKTLDWMIDKVNEKMYGHIKKKLSKEKTENLLLSTKPLCPVHTSNNVECYKLECCFDIFECCFYTVAVFCKNVERILCSFDNIEQIKHLQFSATLSNDRATSGCRTSGVDCYVKSRRCRSFHLFPHLLIYYLLRY